MAEESDAGGGSADDEPADADERGAVGPSDAEPEGDAGADGVDSEVDPEVDSEVERAVGDDGDGTEHESSGRTGEHDGEGDGDGGEDDDGTANAGENGDGTTDEREEPVGAVTDASSPPAASAPGVGDESGGETGDAEPADDDAEPVAGDAFAPDDAGGALDPAAPTGTEDPDSADAEGATADGTGTADAAAGGEPTGADGGSSVHGTVDLPSEGAGAATDLEQVAEGPPDDQEMPLADHVEEMVLRLAIVFGVAAAVAGAVFFFEPLAEDTIMFIWQSVLPDPASVPDDSQIEVTMNPRVYGPLELKLMELKFAGLVGFVLALPVFVYETYRFMRPGLYPHERRYYLAAVPTSLVLAFVGVSFAYFIILPAIFSYFVRYSDRAGLLAFALRQTFDLILVLMGYMALVFQIPLFVMLAVMMGLTDRRWLEGRRLYFWGGFLGVSFLFVPEPTGMAPILVALTMIGLFEGTLTLLRWTGN